MSDYRPYLPELLDAWQKKDYQSVCKELAQDYAKISVFCVDLFKCGERPDLIQLALQLAIYDGGIDTSKLVCVVQTLLEKWDEAIANRDEKLSEDVAETLLEGSKSQLVTFVSSVLNCGNSAEGIYKCGYLTGKLAKLQNDKR